MSANTDIAVCFDELASILEICGESRFRVNAYSRAARALRDLADDVNTLADDGGVNALKKIEGIGDATAKKIVEYLETGAIAAHVAARASIPIGLLDVLSLPGLGPKTVRTLWVEGEVEDVPSLKAAIAAGRLASLPRMGPKTIANLTDAIDFFERQTGRFRLGKALPIAESILAALKESGAVTTATWAGSLRRGRDTIGDVDILATSDDPARLAEVFTTLPEVERILAAGSTKCSVRLNNDLQVDLRIVPAESWGAALMYFTGSKAHNVRLGERAIASGMRLNEYGLYPDDGDNTPPQERGVTAVASATEAEIYTALGLPELPPELREDRGEFDCPSETLTGLVRAEDIRSDLHTHTIASDGRLTIDELAALAKSRGLKVLAITDHSKSSAQANGLDEERLLAHIDAIHAANERLDGITLLAGSEVDILTDGRLDYDDAMLARLDIVVASPHVALRQDPEAATKRLLCAIRHPLVDIIGHPTGRIINKREGLSPDIRALVDAAAETETALEINANHLRLDLRDIHVRAAVDAGALIAIDTDTHSAGNMEQLRYGVLTARRGWLPRERCVNTWSDERLLTWLRRNRG